MILVTAYDYDAVRAQVLKYPIVEAVKTLVEFGGHAAPLSRTLAGVREDNTIARPKEFHDISNTGEMNTNHNGFE